jgi:hypothetical protein
MKKERHEYTQTLLTAYKIVYIVKKERYEYKEYTVI